MAAGRSWTRSALTRWQRGWMRRCKTMAADRSMLPAGSRSITGTDANGCNCGWKMQHGPSDTGSVFPHAGERICLNPPAQFSRYPTPPKRGPFVYRLGRQVFNLERGVRFPYGLPPTLVKLLNSLWDLI